MKLLTSFPVASQYDESQVRDEANVRRHCAANGLTLPGDIEIKPEFHAEEDTPDHWCVMVYEVNNRGG